MAPEPSRTAVFPVAFIHRVTATVSPDRVVGLELIENYAEAAAHLFHRGVLSEEQARRVMTAAQGEGLEISNAELDALLA